MKCTFQMLVDSAIANEKARAKGSQTGSTDPILAQERYKYFMDRLETMDIDVSYLKNLFQELLDKWSEVKQTTNNTSNQRMGLGSFAPSPETIEMMQKNQPLPELKKPSGIKYYY